MFQRFSVPIKNVSTLNVLTLLNVHFCVFNLNYNLIFLINLAEVSRVFSQFSRPISAEVPQGLLLSTITTSYADITLSEPRDTLAEIGLIRNSCDPCRTEKNLYNKE